MAQLGKDTLPISHMWSLAELNSSQVIGQRESVSSLWWEASLSSLPYRPLHWETYNITADFIHMSKWRNRRVTVFCHLTLETTSLLLVFYSLQEIDQVHPTFKRRWLYKGIDTRRWGSLEHVLKVCLLQSSLWCLMLSIPPKRKIYS